MGVSALGRDVQTGRFGGEIFLRVDMRACEKRRRTREKAFVFAQTAEKYAHYGKKYENLYTFNKTVKKYAIIISEKVKNVKCERKGGFDFCRYRR